MKMCKFTPPQLLTAVAAILLGLFSRNECRAQSIDWEGIAPSSAVSSSDTEEKTVFIYNVKEGKFLNRGGSWGTELVLSDVGMEFTISGNDTDGYQFSTKMKGEGDDTYAVTTYINFMGATKSSVSANDNLDYYVDRTETAAYSKFTFTETSSGSKQYRISNQNYYMRVGKNSSGSSLDEYSDVVVNGFSNQASDNSDVWKLVTLKARKEYFAKTAENTKTNVPGTFLILDNDFARRSSDVTSWKGGTTALVYGTNALESAQTPSSQTLTYYIGCGETNSNSNGAKWTANVHGASGDLNQTISPFKHGWYEIRCRAFSTTSTGTPVLYASVDGAESKTDAKTNYAEAAIQKLTTAPTTYLNAESTVNGQNNGDYTYEVVVRVYVPTADEVSADEGSSSTYESCKSLKFGVKTSGGTSSDWLCVDNFELEYLGVGTNAIILDETQPNIEYLNNQVNGKNSTIYLNRSLTAGAWNSILLPFDMTHNDILNIFGSGTKLSKYVGAKNGDKTTIYFEGTTAIEAGKLYIIKPTVGEPDNGDISVSSTTTLPLYKMDNSGNVTKDGDKTLTLTGKYYTIPNIVFGSLDSENKPVGFGAQVTGDTYEVVSGGAQYTFAGTYVKTMNVIPVYSYRINALNADDHTGSQDQWVVNTKSKAHSLGFRGWLQKAAGNTSTEAAALTFVIDGIDDGTTAIDGITFDSFTAPVNNNVYNLNGQLVGTASQLNTLPRGLYIVNGKKVVVK